jgi:hypothetical protein
LSCSSNIDFHPDDDAQDGDVLDEEPKLEIQNQAILATGDVSQMQNGTKGYQPPANRTLFLNCSTPNVVCGAIKCTAGPFDSTFQSSAIITLKMNLNTSTLGMFVYLFLAYLIMLSVIKIMFYQIIVTLVAN